MRSGSTCSGSNITINSINCCHLYLLSYLWYGINVSTAIPLTWAKSWTTLRIRESLTNFHNKHQQFIYYSNNKKVWQSLFWLCNTVRLDASYGALILYIQSAIDWQSHLSEYKPVYISETSCSVCFKYEVQGWVWGLFWVTYKADKHWCKKMWLLSTLVIYYIEAWCWDG